MSPELAVQRAIRLQLIATPSVVALVPASAIYFDRNGNPPPATSIVLGDDIARDEERLSRAVVRVFLNAHIWSKEAGMANAREIAGTIRTAIHAARLDDLDGWHFADALVASTRFMRDFDGVTSHGVVSIEVLAADTESS